MTTIRLTVLAVICMIGSAVRADPACFVTATPVSFGSYDVFSAAPVDVTATITWWCDTSVNSPVVTLSKGSATTFNPRQMSGGSETINYNLFRDPAHTQIWGNGTGGGSQYAYGARYPGRSQRIVLTVYGRLFPLQDAAAGSYSDTITVTLLW